LTVNPFNDANSTKPSDPFTGFWMDLMSRMAGAGRPAATPSQDEVFKQMRQAFFDAWAQYCDEFMRSPAYLEAMKKSMDGALAFKQQVNEMLTRALHEQQIPARSDTDSILLVLRSLEERVLSRIDHLNERVDDLAARVAPAPGAEAAAPAISKPRGASR